LIWLGQIYRHFDDYNAPIAGAGAAHTFGHQNWSSRTERAVHVERGSFYSVEFALAWSPIRSQGNFHRASRFGRVRFQ
jgi:hypothetical protein